MSIKRNFAITIRNADKIDDMNDIIIKNANMTMKSSTHMYFNILPADGGDVINDLTFFQLEGDDEAILNEKLNKLIEELNKLKTDYGLRDEDTGEMIVYVKFLGVLTIKFDKLKIIKENTYEKIDKLKSFKTELGICTGYKPDFRPIEGQQVEKINIKPEKIYLYCHSDEDLMKLKDVLSAKILEIDSDLEISFKKYTESDLKQ